MIRLGAHFFLNRISLELTRQCRPLTPLSPRPWGEGGTRAKPGRVRGRHGVRGHERFWNVYRIGSPLVDDAFVAEMKVGELAVGVFETGQRDRAARPRRGAAHLGDAVFEAVRQ